MTSKQYEVIGSVRLNKYPKEGEGGGWLELVNFFTKNMNNKKNIFFLLFLFFFRERGD